MGCYCKIKWHLRSECVVKRINPRQNQSALRDRCCLTNSSHNSHTLLPRGYAEHLMLLGHNGHHNTISLKFNLMTRPATVIFLASCYAERIRDSPLSEKFPAIGKSFVHSPLESQKLQKRTGDYDQEEKKDTDAWNFDNQDSSEIYRKESLGEDEKNWKERMMKDDFIEVGQKFIWLIAKYPSAFGLCANIPLKFNILQLSICNLG